MGIDIGYTQIKECIHCILNQGDDPDLTFDDRGYCNYCVWYEETYINNARSGDEKILKLKETIDTIKKHGKGKKYDCILGLSGGVDSSYLAHLVKEYDLRPLIIHFDNGWNSEIAVRNIDKIINNTGYDLYTYVVDWDEFKDLQNSYIKSSVIDWEIPTDHGFIALLYRMAAKYSISYILTGHNHQTEAIMPKPFRWSKMDVANIKDIHRKFGKIKLKTMPLLGFFKYNWILYFNKIKRINLLELVNYDKIQAKAVIAKEFDWNDYGGKHYESIFTRFYQGYVLIEKFKVDKRRAHLSNLICSGQLTRQKALDELAKPPYDSQQLSEDREYVLKKLEITESEFLSILKEPPISHLAYNSYEKGLYRTHEKIMRYISPFTRILKKLI
jgi:N-acetyl sugar amidotransferase